MSKQFLTQIKGNGQFLSQSAHGQPIKPKQQGLQLKIRQTARNGKLRRIRYFKIKENRVNLYQVQRYSFRLDNQGVLYFYGFDINDNSIKSFIFANIRSIIQSPILFGVPKWKVQMGNSPQMLRKLAAPKTSPEKVTELIKKDIEKIQGQLKDDLAAAELQVQKYSQQEIDQLQTTQRQIQKTVRKIQPQIIQKSREGKSIIQPRKPIDPFGPVDPR